MNLQELAKSSYEIAQSKGWWDKPRSYAALTLLMQSEISEALEDYRSGKGLNETWYEENLGNGNVAISKTGKLGVDKPCGIPSELADVVIRIADFCGHADLQFGPVEGLSLHAFDDSLALAAYEISQAYVLLAFGPPQEGPVVDPKVAVSMHLSMAVQYIVDLCKQNDIDLWKIVAEKAEYNKTRPMRHGNKQI